MSPKHLTDMRIGATVRARRLIHQSPCAVDEDTGEPPPDVPKGRTGSLDDVDAIDPDCTNAFVDFGAPYGVVLCSPDEISAVTA